MKHTISVIIPVYNAAEYIKRTVRIINESTRTPDEILLVNDGSIDDSWEQCVELQKMYQNVDVLTKTNGGIADARNYGLARATGEYVCFVDQDDYVESDMYEQVFAAIDASELDVVMVSTGQIINGKKIPFEQLKDGYYENDEIRDKLLYSFLFRGYEKIHRSDECSITSSIWKCVIKKQLIDENDIKFRKFISYEDDYIMMTALLSNAKSIRLMSKIGYYWLINYSSESHCVKHIADYGKKTFQLCDYMVSLLEAKGIDRTAISVYSDQLLFEKTIDVIANEFSGLNSKNKKMRVGEIKRYIEEANLLNMDLDNIKPLRAYHRLNVLYDSVKKKSTKKIIRNVSRFIWIEKMLHRSRTIMKILNKRKIG